MVGGRVGDSYESVALNQSVGASVSIESMALHVLKVVVDGVKVTADAILAKLGGTARLVVEVILVQSELLSSSDHHQSPVVIAVAGCRGGGDAVEFVVGQCCASTVVVGDDEHAADQGELVVVDPNLGVSSLEVERISTPDDTRVDCSELNALNDDVYRVLLDGETLALECTLGPNTEDTLVATNYESRATSSVILDRAHGNLVGAVAGESAQVELATSGRLAGDSIAACTSGGRSSEVESLGEQDNASNVVRKIRRELGIGGRGDSCSTASTGCSCSKAVGSADDFLSRYASSGKDDGENFGPHLDG